jgi:uncharacterized protein YjdB
VVTGISAGAPAITYTVPNGCYKTYNVTVNPLPSAITGIAAICVGSAKTLSDATYGGVSWSSSTPSVATIGSSSGVVSGIAAGTSTITYTVNTGCYTTRVVTISSTPAAGTITGANTVIVGNSTTLTDAAVSSGIWSSSNTSVAAIGANTGSLSGIAAGAATITYTVNNGCGAASTTFGVTVTTSRPGGNTAITTQDGISLALYPNPTSGAFTVDATEKGTFTIFTLEGKVAGTFSVEPGRNSLDVPKQLAAGIYMCRYESSSRNTVVVRLVYEP